MTSAATEVHGSYWRTALAFALATVLMNGAHANPRAQPEPSSLLAARPVTEPVEIGAWLSRLVGRYSVKGSVQIIYAPPPTYVPAYPCFEDMKPTDYCMGIKGKSDCVAVGTGPGVQCMFNVLWPDIHEILQPKPSEEGEVNSEPVGVFSLPGGASYLDPAMALFGLNPGAAGIDYLLVDSKGLPEGGPGFVTDNKVTFKTACVNAPALFNAMKPAPRSREEGQPRVCDRIIRIVAKPDGKVVQMSIDIEINGEPWTRHDLALHRDQIEPGAPAASSPGASTVIPGSGAR